MKNYNVRITYTHRKFGPGEGRTILVKATNVPAALARAAREFWGSLTHKERNDVRRSGMHAQLFGGSE